MSFIAGLRCTVCRSPDLDFAQDVINCRRCGQQCPVLGGVPVMFETVSVHTGAAVAEHTARQLLAAFELPDDAVSLLHIRSLMRQQVLFGGALIQVESRQFLDRVRSSGHDISPSDISQDNTDPVSDVQSLDPVRASDPVRADFTTVPRYGWPKNYMPRRVKAGAEFSANMRLENRGDVIMLKEGLRDGAGRIMVAASWQCPDGTTSPTSDVRTPLPIDLHPGQAVTLAVRLVAPAQPGFHRLTLNLVQEQVRWLDDDRITMMVSVETDIPGRVPEGWTLLDEPPASYDADHQRGRDLLAGWLAELVPGLPGARPRMLEVGGNVFPTGAGLDVDLVNVDVDLLGLQIGRLVARRQGHAVKPICADAFNLPFAAGYFDAIVIFASLHHFPDPAALLEQLRRKLRPGGFIGLFCEPVGHIWPGTIDKHLLAELEKGVNEQSFSLREYELMFQQADLSAAEVIVDYDSLKARLVHAPLDDAPPDRLPPDTATSRQDVKRAAP